MGDVIDRYDALISEGRIEKDAARIRYASDIEQLQKESEAALIRAQGRANESAMQVKAYASLLGGVSGSASTYKKLTG